MEKLSIENIISINRNHNGDFYVLFRVENARSINPKANRKANEIIILGIPKSYFNNWCINNKLNLHTLVEKYQL